MISCRLQDCSTEARPVQPNPPQLRDSLRRGAPCLVGLGVALAITLQLALSTTFPLSTVQSKQGAVDIKDGEVLFLTIDFEAAFVQPLEQIFT